MSALRRQVKAGAERLGLSRQLERASEWRHPETRRDRLDNEHLRQLLAFTLRPNSCCVDVGCHEGEILREIVDLAPEGRHIAFEPVPASHARLAAEFEGVDVRHSAASDEDGESEFTVVPGLLTHSGLRERSYPGLQRLEKIVVRTERLDTVLAEDFPLAFLKVDVEGAELQVLRGAAEAIARHRPTIWFEHGEGASDHYGTTPGDVHRLLVGELGLRIFDSDGGGPYSAARFDEVFTQPMWNFVAHP